MGDYLKLFLAAVGNLFGWLKDRTEIANQPDIKEAKKAQQRQELSDKIERLTATAMHNSDPFKREAAIAELRAMDSE